MNIIVVPKNKLKEIYNIKNTILISITSDEPAITNFQEQHILRLYFDDVNSSVDGRLFSTYDANKIKSFIINRPSNIDTILCSCDAGISRSAGVASALMYWMNGSDNEIWSNNKYRPNSFIYHTLLKILFDTE